MKTSNIFLSLIFVASSLSLFANTDEGKKSQKLSMNYAVQTYIDALTVGKVSDLSEVLDSNVKLTTNQAGKIVNFNKKEILESLKGSENLKQNCKTEYNVVEQTENNCIVKVTMAYEVFTKVNYVTITQTNGGWKITNVSSSFQ